MSKDCKSQMFCVVCLGLRKVAILLGLCMKKNFRGSSLVYNGPGTDFVLVLLLIFTSAFHRHVMTSALANVVLHSDSLACNIELHITLLL